MKKLLKLHGLNSDMQYYELIVQHLVAGQFKEGYAMFKAMPQGDRKTFIQQAITNWNSG